MEKKYLKQSMAMVFVFLTIGIYLPSVNADSMYKNWRSFGKNPSHEQSMHRDQQREPRSNSMRHSRNKDSSGDVYSSQRQSSKKQSYETTNKKNRHWSQHSSRSKPEPQSFSGKVTNNHRQFEKKQYARQSGSGDQQPEKRRTDNSRTNNNSHQRSNHNGSNSGNKRYDYPRYNQEHHRQESHHNERHHHSGKRIVERGSDHSYPDDRHRNSPPHRQHDRHEHRQDRHNKSVVVTRPHSPSPQYRIYKRHRHVYYRSPWYNSRYLAPIHFHYHKVGHRVHTLPTSYVRIVVGGMPYFYYYGMFYRPFGNAYVVVTAPIGAVVTHLPVGFIAFSIGLSTFYYANDTYYVWDEPRDAYIVVEKPDGADDAIQSTTKGRLFVYPNAGQDEKQQAKDRYECHQWAVSESGVDPVNEDNDLTTKEHEDYKRAISACLEGRNYTVK